MLSVSLAEYQSIYADVQSEEEYAMLYERAAILLRGWTARRIDKVVTEDDFRYSQTTSAIVKAVLRALFRYQTTDTPKHTRLMMTERQR